MPAAVRHHCTDRCHQLARRKSLAGTHALSRSDTEVLKTLRFIIINKRKQR